MLDNKKYKILILLSILVVSILIILIDSRTTLLATIIPIAYFLVVRNKSKIKYKCNNIIAISIILLFIIGLIILLYFHRPASVIGRFFIWKVSLKMITEKLWLGHGIGSFFSSYMPAQANEFVLSSHRDWACYADNVTHPFNEFIAIACEIGIIGVVIVLLIFIVAWHFAKIQYKSLLLSLVIFAMFSYPTENHLWFIFVVAIFSICLLNDSKSIKLNKLILLSLYIGSVICVYPMSGKYIKPKYESLQYNKHFLSQYAKQLILKQTNDFATLEDIASKIPYIEFYIDIGDLYLKSQKIDNAIKCYNLAKNMSPNRLVARYKLFSILKMLIN